MPSTRRYGQFPEQDVDRGREDGADDGIGQRETEHDTNSAEYGGEGVARWLWLGLRDDLAHRSCGAVGRVKVLTRLYEVLQLCFEERELSLPGVHIFEFAGEQCGDVLAGSLPGLAEGNDAADVRQRQSGSL
jgi:hypothetical protein